MPPGIRDDEDGPWLNCLTGESFDGWDSIEAGGGIDWMIIGGESGPGSRPFDMDWARGTISDCKAAGVAAFFKQAGARPITTQDSVKPGVIVPFKDPKGGDWEEWPEEFRVREYPSCR